MHSCIDGIGRVLAELLRVVLIERRADAHVRALRLTRVHLRQEHGARAEVIAADLRRLEGLGVAHVGVADDGEVVAERLERAQAARRQVEAAARSRPATTCSSRCRTSVLPAAPCTISMQPASGSWRRRALRERRPRRHHGVEQRQRDA